jgi:Na+/melibiose symporter-like transporter
MASVVFGPLFFPSDNPMISTMLSLASFALAFLVRPIGGIIFSHIGDRIGRKKTLVMTLSLMGVSTAAMGLLPTQAQVGAAGGVMLTVLRLIQGLALGGEWAAACAGRDYSPARTAASTARCRRPAPLFRIGARRPDPLDARRPDARERLLAWAAHPVPAVGAARAAGLWIRNRVDETPAFRKIKAERREVKVPIVEIFRTQWPSVLKAIGAKLIETSTFFIFATFSISYAVARGFTRSQALSAVLIAAVVAIPCMLAIGALSDRVGRKKLYLLGTVLAVVYIVPFFWLMNQKSYAVLVAATVLGFGAIWSIYGALMGTFLAESFTADVHTPASRSATRWARPSSAAPLRSSPRRWSAPPTTTRPSASSSPAVRPCRSSPC